VEEREPRWSKISFPRQNQGFCFESDNIAVVIDDDEKAKNCCVVATDYFALL